MMITKNTMQDIKEWYNTKIESEVRDLVYILRNQGFNTTCSCGHGKYIECDYIPDHDYFVIYTLVYNYLYEKYGKVNFELSFTTKVVDDVPYHRIYIDFKTE